MKKRRGRHAKRRKPKGNNSNETCSQESVSMLQECYASGRSGNVWSPGETAPKVENSTQTDFPTLLSIQREMEITKHTKFVGCIVRLKSILSSKDKMVGNELHEVLRNMANVVVNMAEADERDAIPSKETIGYVLRSSDTDNVFRETVQTLLSHLENIIKEDFLQAAGCWRNSVYEMAVEMLNEAVDCDPGIRKMVEFFLRKLLESISTNEERTKNLVLESKSVLVMTFCKSTYLSLTCIYYTIEELKRLKGEVQGGIFAEKSSWSHFVKNSYFLLRILEVCLESMRSKLKVREMDKVLSEEREGKNFNVLEMWRKYWRAGETSREEKTGCRWKGMIGRWADELDEVLVNCVSRFPISAMAVERCKRLAMEILKICSPENETPRDE